MKIPWHQFLSEAEEIHALAVGFGEVVPPWPSKVYIHDHDLITSLVKEYHYYMFGRSLGVVFWLLVILGFRYLF